MIDFGLELDEGLLDALSLIVRERSNRDGWAGKPRALGLSAVTTLRSLGLIETLVPLPNAKGGDVLIRITPDGARALARLASTRL